MQPNRWLITIAGMLCLPCVVTTLGCGNSTDEKITTTFMTWKENRIALPDVARLREEFPTHTAIEKLVRRGIIHHDRTIRRNSAYAIEECGGDLQSVASLVRDRYQQEEDSLVRSYMASALRIDKSEENVRFLSQAFSNEDEPLIRTTIALSLLELKGKGIDDEHYQWIAASVDPATYSATSSDDNWDRAWLVVMYFYEGATPPRDIRKQLRELNNDPNCPDWVKQRIKPVLFRMETSDNGTQ